MFSKTKEMISGLYRGLLPIPVWFTYFLNQHQTNGHIFSCILAGLYLTMKLNGILKKLAFVANNLKAFVFWELPFGSYATPEEVAEVGDMCAVCQEKMTSPVKLSSCRHIFCELCVSEWFEREKTCPLCRAVIKCAGSRTHSDGSTSMLVQLF